MRELQSAPSASAHVMLAVTGPFGSFTTPQIRGLWGNSRIIFLTIAQAGNPEFGNPSHHYPFRAFTTPQLVISFASFVPQNSKHRGMT